MSSKVQWLLVFSVACELLCKKDHHTSVPMQLRLSTVTKQLAINLNTMTTIAVLNLSAPSLSIATVTC